MDCIFCKIINGEIPSYKIYEDELIYAFLDINPLSIGHTLVIPKKHTLDVFSISKEELDYILESAKKISKLLKESLGADGMTFAMNTGIAEEVKHFHLHIIPKYKNEVKMDLDEVYKKIKKITK